jgi:hypothetical protein
MSSRSVLVCVLCACATTPKPTAVVEAPVAEAEATAEPSPAAPEAFTNAWAPPEAPTPTAAPRSVDEAPAVVDRRGPFREAMRTATTALGAKRYDDARAAAVVANAEATALHGAERDQAGQLAFRIETAAGEPVKATSAALAWLRRCGPEQLERCRANARAALKASGGPGASALATRLTDAERCVSNALRDPTATACLSHSEATAAAADDTVLQSQALLARALAEKAEARKVLLLEKLEHTCPTAPGCVPVRRRALQRLAALAQASGELERALGFLIKDAQLLAATQEPELKAWARPAELDALCRRVDSAKTSGTCRGLEKQLAGGWTFRDYSKDKAGTGLTAEVVRSVNEHYSPLLQECLAEQARRMTPPDAQRFEVYWVVHNDGHVRDAHLRRDLDATPLAVCVRKQFSTWRYPRFDGEFQNVTQSFTVTATTQRSAQ